MILPVIAYGHPVLKKKAVDIDPKDESLGKLIEDMFDTMYSSKGVGLAGPQVNQSKRIFVVDATPFAEEDKQAEGFKKVFLNPEIIELSGKMKMFEEGCLSFPGLRESIEREEVVRLQYYDKDFNFHDEEFDGIISRIIQHEYDHIEGRVFVDRISRIRKTLLKRRLSDISTGNVDADYKMLFPNRKKGR